jgi:membrane-associated protease RseP (regulator of RpoE activity)
LAVLQLFFDTAFIKAETVTGQVQCRYAFSQGSGFRRRDWTTSRGIVMDPTIAALFFYVVIWIGVYLVGRVIRLERFGFVLSPLYFMYKTTALNEWIDSVAQKRRGLWRTLGNVGIVTGIGLMVFAIYKLGQNLYNLFYHVQAAYSIQPVLPLPGLTISWESFPYLVVAISLVLGTHELAHGIATRVDNVPLKSAGIFVAVVLFGGFVEPDEERLEKASSQTQMRVYTAGSFTNAALGLVVLLLFANFAATIAPFYAENHGVKVVGLTLGDPAEIAGIRSGDIIVGVNGKSVHTIADWQNAMKYVSPGTQVTVVTSRGDFQIVTRPDPNNSSRAILGVSLSEFIIYTGRYTLVPSNLPNVLLYMEYWIANVFVSVAFINMLPLYVFDGDRFLEAMLRAIGAGRTKEIRMFASSVSLAILGLNFAVSMLRFGFIKL